MLDTLRSSLADPAGDYFLFGPSGSGKSHLLTAVCHALREQGRDVIYLPAGRLQDPAILEGLEQAPVICVDDLHAVLGHRAWEEGVFHLINRLRRRQGRLYFAADRSPATLAVNLPDLQSRLGAMTQLSLLPPDDEDKREILQRFARRQGFELPPAVTAYLVSHGRRQTSDLLDAARALQRTAFAAKRRITVPMARGVLQELGQK